jgi:hypothetical protein
VLLPSLTRYYLVLFGTYKLTIFAALRTKPKKPRLLSGIALLAKFATAYRAVKPAAATGVRPIPANGNRFSMFHVLSINGHTCFQPCLYIKRRTRLGYLRPFTMPSDANTGVFLLVLKYQFTHSFLLRFCTCVFRFTASV